MFRSLGVGIQRTSRATVSLGRGLSDGFQSTQAFHIVLVDDEINTVNGVTPPAINPASADLDIGLKYRIAAAERGPMSCRPL